MRFFVGVTDWDWYSLHASASSVEEVNFWKPSPKAGFVALQPGELFLFKLHSPKNFIAGGAFFSKFTSLPVCLALEAFGYGPFSIANNHFSSGGPVNTLANRLITQDFLAPSANAKSYTDPLLIAILNLGLAIEDVNQGDGFAAAYQNRTNAEVGAARRLAHASSGTVLFTNNICQLEAWASRVTGIGSVNILSYDSVVFTSNQLWVDAPPLTAITDALLLGATMQMSDNRLQECQYYPVIASGLTVGIANVTSSNIATYCLKAIAPAVYLINTPNVILWPFLCPPAKGKVAGTGANPVVKGQ